MLQKRWKSKIQGKSYELPNENRLIWIQRPIKITSNKVWKNQQLHWIKLGTSFPTIYCLPKSKFIPVDGVFTHYATQNKILSILSSLEQRLPNAKLRDQVGRLQGSRMSGHDVLLDRFGCIWCDIAGSTKWAYVECLNALNIAGKWDLTWF